MKHRNWGYVVFPLITVLIAIFIFRGLSVDERKESTMISVFVEDESTDRWKMCKQGLDSAGNEMEIDINFIMIDSSMSIAERIDAISREVANGSQGLILDIGVRELLIEYLDVTVQSIPIVLMESEIDSSMLYSCIAVDQKRLGQEIGQALLNHSQKQPCKVGIVLGRGNKNAYSERAESIIEKLQESDGVEVVWNVQGTAYALPGSLSYRMREEPVDYLLTLENYATEIAVDYKESENPDIAVIGVGNTEKNLYHLDKGNIEVLFVPDEFKMGYFAVHELVNQMQGMVQHQGESKYEAAGNEVEYYTVTKENLFDEETQYLLFPKLH